MKTIVLKAMQAIAEGGEDVMNVRQDRRRRSEISREAPRHIPDEIQRNLREVKCHRKLILK